MKTKISGKVNITDCENKVIYIYNEREIGHSQIPKAVSTRISVQVAFLIDLANVFFSLPHSQKSCYKSFGGACGVIVIIVIGNGHSDTSSNPGPD